MTDGSVLIVKEIDGELTLRPIFWRALQPLKQRTGDAFGIEQREDRFVEFVRDAQGCVNAVKISGFGDDGTFPRLGDGRAPVEFLLAGQPEKAAELMIKADKRGVERFTAMGRNLLARFPSKAADAAGFLETLSRYYPNSAETHAALGDARIATGERCLALKSFRRSLDLDSDNSAAATGLRRLNAIHPTPEEIAAGWTVPFPLDYVFAAPTEAEIKASEADWAKRDLSVNGVREVKTDTVDLGRVKAQVKIISHIVRGYKHYGAIIIPEGAGKGKQPVILDLKGVSWNYFPLDLNNLQSPAFLGSDQGKFIYIVPSFRGEVMKFGGVEYLSGGDRTDSWDGATDDALALLNAALSITPQADAARICAFGKSRGGSVALLAGIRDKRINRVLDWAGPADWFSLMATGGWTQEEIIRDALLKKASPKEDGGQFIERFLLKAVAGRWGLANVRQRMLRNSPLYFAARLPRTQMHYGIEDEMVPVANGRALAAATKAEVFFHENSGHDLDQKIAFRESRRFVMEMLGR